MDIEARKEEPRCSFCGTVKSECEGTLLIAGRCPSRASWDEQRKSWTLPHICPACVRLAKEMKDQG